MPGLSRLSLFGWVSGNTGPLPSYYETYYLGVLLTLLHRQNDLRITRLMYSGDGHLCRSLPLHQLFCPVRKTVRRVSKKSRYKVIYERQTHQGNHCMVEVDDDRQTDSGNLLVMPVCNRYLLVPPPTPLTPHPHYVALSRRPPSSQNQKIAHCNRLAMCHQQ